MVRAAAMVLSCGGNMWRMLVSQCSPPSCTTQYMKAQPTTTIKQGHSHHSLTFLKDERLGTPMIKLYRVIALENALDNSIYQVNVSVCKPRSSACIRAYLNRLFYILYIQLEDLWSYFANILLKLEMLTLLFRNPSLSAFSREMILTPFRT